MLTRSMKLSGLVESVQNCYCYDFSSKILPNYHLGSFLKKLPFEFDNSNELSNGKALLTREERENKPVTKRIPRLIRILCMAKVKRQDLI